MKKYISIFLLFVSVSTFAQKSYDKADKLFDQMRYVEAAKMYEKGIDRGDHSMEVLQKAGNSYYYNTNMEQANKWYDLLISKYKNEVNPEYLFRFAHTLRGTGNYKSANKWMKAFAEASEKADKRIQDYAQKEQTLADVMAIPPAFELSSIDINTIYSDFGPTYYGNKLVYSSAIDTSFYKKRRYHWNKQPFLNFYEGQINATETNVKRERLFSKSLKTQYHEATLAFTKDLKRVYFTRNNYNKNLKRDEEGVNHLKLYTAEIDDNVSSDWSNIQELPFNSDAYSVGHPTLSEDGKKLYFASDMPGSIGGTDLFVVNILDNNTYSEPKNLGPKINTSGREMFPYISKNTLYFSSDGHLGIGGLDVFESKMSDTFFEEPKNLGLPLNSNLDDFGFIVNEINEQGFICSNRAGGKGDDDIYAFTRMTPEIPPKDVKTNICKQALKGYVSNTRTGGRISDVTVALYNKQGLKLTQTQSKINGDYQFIFDLTCNERYEVRVEKTGYNPNNKTFVTSSISAETIVPLELETIDQLIVEDNGQLKIKVGIIFFNTDKHYIRTDAALELNKIVTLMLQQPDIKIRIESHTDSRADDAYNLALSQRRANATKDYLIKQGIAPSRIAQATGYGETQLMNTCENGVRCEEEEHQLNRRSEFVIVKM